MSVIRKIQGFQVGDTVMVSLQGHRMFGRTGKIVEIDHDPCGTGYRGMNILVQYKTVPQDTPASWQGLDSFESWWNEWELSLV